MRTIFTHYDITMDNDVARDIHCDVTMNNDIAICTYHSITMHNGIAISILLCITTLIYDITVSPVKSLKLFIKH